MRAMPQAMEWSLATPMTRPRLPAIRPERVCGSVPVPGVFWSMLVQLLENQAGIGAAEAEAVRQGGVDRRIVDALAYDVGAFHRGIELLDIGAFADEAVLHHQQRINRLMHSGGALAVAGERLRRADRRHLLAEHAA